VYRLHVAVNGMVRLFLMQLIGCEAKTICR
jgi:hypothetical protein